MPPESLLIGIALVVAILAVVPAGRRLLATLADVVDGSIALYAIRRALGRDTTTARERRIADRRAREQQDLLRRIGGTGGPTIPVATPPTRIVVSGDRPTASSAAPGTPVPGSSAPRAALVRGAAIAAVGVAIVVVAAGALLDRPLGGVLGITGTPSPSAAGPQVAGAPTAGTAAPSPARGTGAAPGAPTRLARPSAAVPSAAAVPVVGRLDARLAGRTAVGRTAATTLSWDLAERSVPAGGFVLSGRSGEGTDFRPVATLPGDARSHLVRLVIGQSTTYRLIPVGIDGVEGVARDWPPITATRHQETSRLATTDGTWRRADGPSLSGGGVTFSSDRRGRFTFAFEGTDVGWVATRTPQSGQAEVRLDGELVDTVDLAADAVRYRQLVLRHHAEVGGAHVLEIRPLGDGRVDVDAILVLR